VPPYGSLGPCGLGRTLLYVFASFAVIKFVVFVVVHLKGVVNDFG